MKCFLLARARLCVASVAMLHIDHVLRIHTDNVTFDHEFDDVIDHFKTYPELKKEDKTTGIIKWSNANNGVKV